VRTTQESFAAASHVQHHVCEDHNARNSRVIKPAYPAVDEVDAKTQERVDDSAMH
jgi:hypothetical protein